MTQFERHLLETVREVREKLAVWVGLSSFNFTINASGRILDGEVEVKFTLGKWSGEVEGGDLQAVVDEFARRHGWNKRHAPLCLPAAPLLPEGVTVVGFDDMSKLHRTIAQAVGEDS